MNTETACVAIPRKAGRNAGYRAGCRCTNCTAGARRYEKHRKTRRATGWQPFVDAGPARDHVNELRAAGMGVKRITEKAGVAYTVVQRLAWGIQGATPTQKIRPQNAAAILAVTLDPYDGAMIDGTGSRRRIEALMCQGWSQQQIARQLGWAQRRISAVRSNKKITACKARELSAVFEKLWNVEPPQVEPWEKGSVVRTLKFAARNGFAPTLAWDDDTIDDPAAEPHRALVRDRSGSIDEIAVAEAVYGRKVRLTSAERGEAIRRLTERGCSAHEIADRLRTTKRSVGRRRARAAA